MCLRRFSTDASGLATCAFCAETLKMNVNKRRKLNSGFFIFVICGWRSFVQSCERMKVPVRDKCKSVGSIRTNVPKNGVQILKGGMDDKPFYFSMRSLSVSARCIE